MASINPVGAKQFRKSGSGMVGEWARRLMFPFKNSKVKSISLVPSVYLNNTNFIDLFTEIHTWHYGFIWRIHSILPCKLIAKLFNIRIISRDQWCCQWRDWLVIFGDVTYNVYFHVIYVKVLHSLRMIFKCLKEVATLSLFNKICKKL